MKSDDQLRQRAAWALIQVYVISHKGSDFPWQTEHWVFYYDILVRNAFGNLRSILTEISFNGMMAGYLSFHGSGSLASSGTLPDENYAREIMQLFSIGLVELEPDGTLMRDETTGVVLETYDTFDIKEFAKCWTAFETRPQRGNIERGGHVKTNKLDPMQLKANGRDGKRDLFPKFNLYNGHLGDGYPLCADLPLKHFLAKHARWSYLGLNPNAVRQPEALAASTAYELSAASWLDGVPRLTLDPSASSLHAALCRRPNGASSATPCSFASEVELNSSLPCHGKECLVDTVIVVDVLDLASNVTVYYEYMRRPCTELTFSHGAKVAASPTTSGAKNWCSDPTLEAAAAACCPPSHSSATVARADCVYANEVMTYATAASRCAQRTDGYTQVCSARASVSGCFGGVGMRDEPSWLATESSGSSGSNTCTAQVQVFPDGQVTLSGGAATDDTSQQVDSGNIFRVRWEAGSYPSAGSDGTGCPARCTLSSASSCLCDIEVSMDAAFTDPLTPPTVVQLDERLSISSAEPDTFAAGTYTKCATAACDAARAAGVTVWSHSSSSSGGAFDTLTVFEIVRNSTRPTYLANKVSTVRVPGTAFRFRNPPKFHSFLRPSVRDAEHETEALIDHLLYHKNTAPFLAHRLIQRVTTSNPSPRYVMAVSEAFRTGSFGGRTYSGVHGDLGATFAAILLDREARSITLEADPTHGGLREPLLKLYQLMRSLEFRTAYDQIGTITPDFGQDFMRSPSVFNVHAPPCRAATHPTHFFTFLLPID